MSSTPMREAVVDANILLRYLTNEPEDLADQAAAILNAADAHRVPLVVAPLTVAEVVYVLEKVYRWERATIAERLLTLISASVLTVIEQESVVRALAWYRDFKGLHFADAYLAALAIDRGHGRVVSFDRQLGRLEGITLVQRPGQLEGRDLAGS